MSPSTMLGRQRKFLAVDLTVKRQICILHQKTFMKKNCIKELCKESFKLNYAEFRIQAEKDCLYFYKINQSMHINLLL